VGGGERSNGGEAGPVRFSVLFQRHSNTADPASLAAHSDRIHLQDGLYRRGIRALEAQTVRIHSSTRSTKHG
jgi:hypothetical protein